MGAILLIPLGVGWPRAFHRGDSTLFLRGGLPGLDPCTFFSNLLPSAGCVWSLLLSTFSHKEESSGVPFFPPARFEHNISRSGVPSLETPAEAVATVSPGFVAVIFLVFCR